MDTPSFSSFLGSVVSSREAIRRRIASQKVYLKTQVEIKKLRSDIKSLAGKLEQRDKSYRSLVERLRTRKEYPVDIRAGMRHSNALLSRFCEAARQEMDAVSVQLSNKKRSLLGREAFVREFKRKNPLV